MIETTVEKELEKGAAASIINLVDCLIRQAYTMRASDIHIDPTQKEVRIRFRIDGALQEMYVFPKTIHREVVSRVKIIAGLRIDEHNSTQDGRCRQIIGDTEHDCVDIRISIAPTYHGENVVMRLLSDREQHFSLDALGFSEDDQKKIMKAIKKPTGMILATGPTGSGKTTTLYTLVKMLNAKDISIVTLEDPIEYAVEGIEQIQVNPFVGLTFASGLRSLLRQDPDIIMVGEIRDLETASIAVNTALTGHLLLSTLHTNDAATTLPRLMEMRIEPYLVASTVSIAIGQRLVRRLCEKCKEKHTFTEAEQIALSDIVTGSTIPVGAKLFKSVGCADCNQTGFRGRIGVNEVLVSDGEVREAILKKSSAKDIRDIAIRNGMTTMLEDGMQKVQKGLTTVAEVLRVVHE